MIQQPPPVLTLEHVSVYLGGLVNQEDVGYHQNYPLSIEAEKKLKSHFGGFPNYIEFTKDSAPKELIPGGLPDNLLGNLVFKDSFDRAIIDGENWRLYYLCKPHVSEKSPVTLETYLNLSLVRDEQEQPFLQTNAWVSCDIGEETGEMKTDLTLLGMSYARKYVYRMIINSLKRLEIEAIKFIPLENAGYLLNALMHLGCNIKLSHLKQLYELRYAAGNIGRAFPSWNVSEKRGASVRRLNLAADSAYREKQEELIEMLGSPFMPGNAKYCELP